MEVKYQERKGKTLIAHIDETLITLVGDVTKEKRKYTGELFSVKEWEFTIVLSNGSLRVGLNTEAEALSVRESVLAAWEVSNG